MPSYFLNKKTKKRNINKDTEKTTCDENEECYSESEDETYEECFKENLSEEFQNSKHDLIEVEKNEENNKTWNKQW